MSSSKRSPSKLEDRKRERDQLQNDDFKRRRTEKPLRPWIDRPRQFKNVQTQTEDEKVSIAQSPPSIPNVVPLVWYNRAKLIVADLQSERNQKLFNIFTTSLKTVAQKLQNHELKTKSSFKCALEEIAEIALDRVHHENETFFKAQYLKTYIRLHWDVHFEKDAFMETDIAHIRRRMTRLHRKIRPNSEQHIEPDLIHQ